MNVFPLPAVPFDGRSRTVEMGSAFDWYRQGWAIFAVQPGRWLVMTFGVALVYLLLALLPTVGWPVAQLLTPLLAAILLLGCHSVASEAGPPVNGRLTVLSTHSLQPLAALGGLFLLGATLVRHLVRLAVDDATRPAMRTGLMPEALPPFGDWLSIGVLGTLLSLPLLMAFWFTPALVVFQRLRPIAALHASLQACLKNAVALLVYGTILLTLVFLAVLPAGLGILILGPVLAGSVYAAYRDIFLAT